MGEEGADLRGAHIFWVSLVMKQNETFHPVDVAFFGADAHMFETEDLSHLVEQFRF